MSPVPDRLVVFKLVVQLRNIQSGSISTTSSSETFGPTSWQLAASILSNGCQHYRIDLQHDHWCGSGRNNALKCNCCGCLASVWQHVSHSMMVQLCTASRSNRTWRSAIVQLELELELEVKLASVLVPLLSRSSSSCIMMVLPMSSLPVSMWRSNTLLVLVLVLVQLEEWTLNVTGRYTTYWEPVY